MYDLRTDPTEKNNIIKLEPEQADKLKTNFLIIYQNITCRRKIKKPQILKS